jgi:hypothetical protein
MAISANRAESKVIIGAILKSLAAAGALTSSLAAPGFALLVDEHLRRLKIIGADSKKLAEQLKAQKLMLVNDRPDGSVEVTLSLAGWRRVQKYTLETLEIERPSRWDEKWHMVMFDIPEKNKAARNAFSMKLKKLGFLQWQRSAWVYPFECETEIMTIAQVYGIDQHVTYAVISHTNGAAQLQRKFAHLIQY